MRGSTEEVSTVLMFISKALCESTCLLYYSLKLFITNILRETISRNETDIVLLKKEIQEAKSRKAGLERTRKSQ